MGDDWLWDGSGRPDPQTERIAAGLGTLRYDGSAPAVGRRRTPWGPLAVGAALLAATALVWLTRPTEGWPCGPGCVLGVGQWLRTEAPVELQVADIGTMQVDPGSELRLVATGADQHRLELREGRIRASVNAPPRLLVVDTPSASAVDLGCAYDLSVLADGSSLLLVDRGEVSLEGPTGAAGPGRVAYVPADAAALTWPGHGPGIPWFVDAPVDYADALVAIDRDGELDRLADLLARSRPRDTLSLWHLLQRVPRDRRAAVVDRLAELAPTPDLDRAQLLALDRDALVRLRDHLADRW